MTVYWCPLCRMRYTVPSNWTQLGICIRCAWCFNPVDTIMYTVDCNEYQLRIVSFEADEFQ